jgi:hypothetical protein
VHRSHRTLQTASEAQIGLAPELFRTVRSAEHPSREDAPRRSRLLSNHHFKLANLAGLVPEHRIGQFL